MAYGNELKRLNPCDDEVILCLLKEYCLEPHRILDAGCGRGNRLAAIRDIWPQVLLYGIDLDEDNTASALKMCPTADIRRGDICSLPADWKELDAILCECTLSLTESPEKVLTGFYDILHREGIVLIGDLCIDGNDDPVAVGGTVIRYLFSRVWIEKMFRKAGFQVVMYRDCSKELLTMAAQMVFDGNFCACIDNKTLRALRLHRTGYDLWILKKEVGI